MIKYLAILLACYYAAEARNVCYDDLGCFTDESPFGWTLQRPISYLPDTPEKISTKFMLYTRRNQNNADIVRYNSIGSYYDPSKPTKFIIHGFLHNGIKKWVLDIKDNFLSIGDYNIIGVDWSKGNGPSYIQSVANTQIVGAEIARFINTMILDHGSNAVDFHVIGHSLGSHIAGYAGERVKNLGRITGLDPAGPYFENTPPEVRLDPTDAVFVDVIHSDGTANLLLGLGLMQPLGHVDFYPNGGKDQPKCPKTSDKVLGAVFNLLILDIDGIEDTVACSHMAAVHFFTDSIINTKCTYNGFQCTNEEEFNNGKCVKCSSKGCNRMGFWASPENDRGTLYLNTQPSTSANFCQQNFGVTLHSGKIDKQNQARGFFTIQLESAEGYKSTFEILDDNENTFKKNSAENRLLSLTSRFDRPVHQLNISYRKTNNFFSSWLYDDQWNFSLVELQAGDSQQYQTFCQKDMWINSGKTVVFNKC